MFCPDCEKLKERVEKLEKENQELKRRLALYENANVPPSQRRYPTRYNGGSSHRRKRFPGRPKGHPGTTRQVPKPNVVEKPEWKECPQCGAPLRKPTVVKHHIVEEIPEPSPVMVQKLAPWSLSSRMNRWRVSRLASESFDRSRCIHAGYSLKTVGKLFKPFTSLYLFPFSS